MYRQVTRTKSESGAMVEHQRTLVVLKLHQKINVKLHFKSSATALYCSLVISLMYDVHV